MFTRTRRTLKLMKFPAAIFGWPFFCCILLSAWHMLVASVQEQISDWIWIPKFLCPRISNSRNQTCQESSRAADGRPKAVQVHGAWKCIHKLYLQVKVFRAYLRTDAGPTAWISANDNMTLVAATEMKTTQRKTCFTERTMTGSFG